jgi:hypothetical protein
VPSRSRQRLDAGAVTMPEALRNLSGVGRNGILQRGYQTDGRKVGARPPWFSGAYPGERAERTAHGLQSVGDSMSSGDCHLDQLVNECESPREGAPIALLASRRRLTRPAGYQVRPSPGRCCPV